MQNSTYHLYIVKSDAHAVCKCCCRMVKVSYRHRRFALGGRTTRLASVSAWGLPTDVVRVATVSICAGGSRMVVRT